jgi:hypothetical protein
MGRKKPINPNPSPELIRFREKRKWQIALRRYVLETGFSTQYAPYFGLDRKSIRNWFEIQFANNLNWSNVGTAWQFDHIVPVIYFDFSKEEELRMCWNFTNLKVEAVHLNKNKGAGIDVLAAKAYFHELYSKTQYEPCRKLLSKIDYIEQAELVSSEKQLEFIKQHRAYLDAISDYSIFEFDLLNRGRGVEDVNKEVELLKNIRI